MPSIQRRLAQIPEGSGVLFFVQLFATLGFAVLSSTLVLYATQHLHFTAKQATAIMGVFGAFNYVSGNRPGPIENREVSPVRRA